MGRLRCFYGFSRHYGQQQSFRHNLPHRKRTHKIRPQKRDRQTARHGCAHEYRANQPRPYPMTAHAGSFVTTRPAQRASPHPALPHYSRHRGDKATHPTGNIPTPGKRPECKINAPQKGAGKYALRRVWRRGMFTGNSRERKMKEGWRDGGW